MVSNIGFRMITLEFLDINHSPLQIRGAFVISLGFFPVKLHVFCYCTFYFCYFIKNNFFSSNFTENGKM
jgi:hypothetical protein